MIVDLEHIGQHDVLLLSRRKCDVGLVRAKGLWHVVKPAAYICANEVEYPFQGRDQHPRDVVCCIQSFMTTNPSDFRTKINIKQCEGCSPVSQELVRCCCSVHKPGPRLAPNDHVRDAFTVLGFIIRVFEHPTCSNSDSRRRWYLVTTDVYLSQAR